MRLLYHKVLAELTTSLLATGSVTALGRVGRPFVLWPFYPLVCDRGPRAIDQSPWPVIHGSNLGQPRRRRSQARRRRVAGAASVEPMLRHRRRSSPERRPTGRTPLVEASIRRRCCRAGGQRHRGGPDTRIASRRRTPAGPPM